MLQRATRRHRSSTNHGILVLAAHNSLVLGQRLLVVEQRADPALRALPYTFGCMEPLRYAENDEVAAVLDDAVSERPPTIMLTPRRTSRGDFDV
ncbi:hypothetical protein BN1723_005385 [Verticillium longisporum]|uniref:Uncharacterized protein n=1 Tax=Verticillium longisporum TaxID=100787 RepID=A0A0G4N8S3_VERLO|nr:hypothetical protein BN1723_005385 [Verticillium longisporum]